jgi:hypothetical protein
MAALALAEQYKKERQNNFAAKRANLNRKIAPPEMHEEDARKAREATRKDISKLVNPEPIAKIQRCGSNEDLHLSEPTS